MFEFNSILSFKTSLKSEFISIKSLEGGFYPEGGGELKTRMYLHLVDGLITGGGIVCGSLRYSDDYLPFDRTKLSQSNVETAPKMLMVFCRYHKFI